MKAVDLSYNETLQSFSTNLFNKVGLNYFKHTRIYQNYKTIVLLTNPANVESNQEGSGLSFQVNHSPENMKLQIKIDQGFSFVISTDNHIDIFDFSAKPENDNSTALFQKHNHFLHDYIKNYIELFDSAINASKNNSIKMSQTHNNQEPIKQKNNTNKKIFTQRELDCVNFLMAGFTAKHTARKLNISPRTVEKHLDNIKLKLGVSRKIEIMSKVRETEGTLQ